MATDQSFVDYIYEQADLPNALIFKKMFGEYALYLDGKVIALVCDNQLFVKPTTEGSAILAEFSTSLVEQPPYPGAKPHLLIDAALDDRECLKALFKATARALPMPKPKAASRKKISQ